MKMTLYIKYASLVYQYIILVWSGLVAAATYSITLVRLSMNNYPTMTL